MGRSICSPKPFGTASDKDSLGAFKSGIPKQQKGSLVDLENSPFSDSEEHPGEYERVGLPTL
jgi:hypothetical protein